MAVLERVGVHRLDWRQRRPHRGRREPLALQVADEVAHVGGLHVGQPAPGEELERVRFQVTEDAAAELQRFAAGDLHITEVVPPQPLPALRKRFGAQLRLSPYLGAFWLGINLTRPQLRSAACATPPCEDRELALRRALTLAIDRDKLTRYVTGLGETPAYGIVPPGIPGYTPAAMPWQSLSQTQR